MKHAIFLSAEYDCFRDLGKNPLGIRSKISVEIILLLSVSLAVVMENEMQVNLLVNPHLRD